MRVASRPCCIFLVHLSLPSQHDGGGNILASGEERGIIQASAVLKALSERATKLGLMSERARTDRLNKIILQPAGSL